MSIAVLGSSPVGASLISSMIGSLCMAFMADSVTTFVLEYKSFCNVRLSVSSANHGF